MIRRAILRRGWALPLLLSLFVDNVRGTPVRAAAVLSAAAWALLALSAAPRPPGRSRLWPLFLLWSLAGVFSSPYAANTLAEWSVLAAAVLFSWGMGALLSLHPEERPAAARGLLALGLFRAALYLARPSWAVSNLSFVPMVAALGALAAAGEPALRGPRAALAAMSGGIALYTHSLTALLGLVVGLPLGAGVRTGRRAWLAAALAAGALVAGLALSGRGPAWLRYNPDDPHRLERLAIWRDTLAIVKDHPVAGTGLGTFEQVYPRYKSWEGLRTANFAHNEWLQALAETGLVGGLILALLLAGLLRRIRGAGPAAAGPASALAALGLWACLYFVFRCDALLFSGAALTALASARPLGAGSPAAGAPPAGAPLRRAEKAGAAALAAAACAVALSQGTAQIWERLGGAAWDAGDAPLALERFRAAARWNPLEPRFLDHQVECLRRLDRKAETLPLLERAVALKPRDVWLRRKLAVARLALAGPAAARETYAPILKLAPRVEQFRREYDELTKMEAP